MRLFLLIVSASCAFGCATVTPSVGQCQSLQVDSVGERLLVVCWTDEASMLQAIQHPELLGPTQQDALGLFKQFDNDREQLQLRGMAEPRVVSGFQYRLSYPQIVDGRAQYNLEVNLPTPLPAASISGPTQEVVAFVKEKYPDANTVSIDLLPTSSGTFGSVTMHFEQWNLRSVTITQYRSRG